jgi:hypothetical protein
MRAFITSYFQMADPLEQFQFSKATKSVIKLNLIKNLNGEKSSIKQKGFRLNKRPGHIVISIGSLAFRIGFFDLHIKPNFSSSPAQLKKIKVLKI